MRAMPLPADSQAPERLQLPGRSRWRVALAVIVPLAFGLGFMAWAQMLPVVWLWISALLVVAVAVLAGHLAVRPIEELGRTLARRDRRDLSPLPDSRSVEVQTVVHGMNALLEHQRSANERQRRFLADASHQLRTPLAVLRTQLQSTADGAIEHRVPDLLRTVDRATGVVNQLLSQMKLDQRLARRTVWPALRIDGIAQEAALEFSPLITARRLQFSLDAQPLAVPADAWMMGELVRNLLANAIQHTPHGAPLGIVIRRAAGLPELIVWDSGPGITDEVRERLFEPFTAATGGTGVGLGLSICRQLAQAMGADVQLFNRTDGDNGIGVDAVIRWGSTAAHSPTETQGDTQ
jgi:signal transduction histidine kinase